MQNWAGCLFSSAQVATVRVTLNLIQDQHDMIPAELNTHRAGSKPARGL